MLTEVMWSGLFMYTNAINCKYCRELEFYGVIQEFFLHDWLKKCVTNKELYCWILKKEGSSLYPILNFIIGNNFIRDDI